MSIRAGSMLDKLPHGDTKDNGEIFAGPFRMRAALLDENPDRRDQRVVGHLARELESINVHAVLTMVSFEGGEDYLDGWIMQRDAGTLAEFVKERAAAGSEKRTLSSLETIEECNFASTAKLIA